MYGDIHFIGLLILKVVNLQKRTTKKRFNELLKHMHGTEVLAHRSGDFKAHPFNPSFILCPDNIPVKAARYISETI